MTDAFTTDPDLSLRSDNGTKKIVVAAIGRQEIISGKGGAETEFYELINESNPVPKEDKICLGSLMLSDKIIDEVIAYTLKTGAAFMAVAARTLTEVGKCDARFHLSPVMLLHKLGLLKNAKIVGGVYLDNDDVDLMVQENATLILTPSHDAGYGNGIPNAVSYLKRGLKIALGSGDNRFNKNRGIEFEAEILQLLSSASLNTPSAIPGYDLKKMCGG